MLIFEFTNPFSSDFADLCQLSRSLFHPDRHAQSPLVCDSVFQERVGKGDIILNATGLLAPPVKSLTH